MAEKKALNAQELADFQKRAARGITDAVKHPGMQVNPYLNMLRKLQDLFGVNNEDETKKKKGK